LCGLTCTDSSNSVSAEATRTTNESCGQVSGNVAIGHHSWVPQQTFFARPSSGSKTVGWGFSADEGATISQQSGQTTEIINNAPFVNNSSMGEESTGSSLVGDEQLAEVTTGQTKKIDNLGQWKVSYEFVEKPLFYPAACFTYAAVHTSSWTIPNIHSGSGGLLGCAEWWYVNEHGSNGVAPTSFNAVWNNPNLYEACIVTFPYHNGWHQLWLRDASGTFHNNIDVYASNYQYPTNAQLQNATALPSPSSCSSGVTVPSGAKFQVNYQQTSDAYSSGGVTYTNNLPAGLDIGPFSISPSSIFGSSDFNNDQTGSGKVEANSIAWYNTLNANNYPEQWELLCPTSGLIVKGQTVVTAGLVSNLIPQDTAFEDHLGNYIGSWTISDSQDNIS
jgi:hypothetical protein